MTNRKKFGEKISPRAFCAGTFREELDVLLRKCVVLLLAISIAFLQMPAAYSEGPIAPGETNANLPTASPDQPGDADPSLPNPNAGSGALSLADEIGSGAAASDFSLGPDPIYADANRNGKVGPEDIAVQRANFGLTATQAGRALTSQDGDFNGDQVVDAADYIVYRKLLGVQVAVLPGDFNGDLAVDGADYVAGRKMGLDLTPYRTHFGDTLIDAYRDQVMENTVLANDFSIAMGNVQFVGWEWRLTDKINALQGIKNDSRLPASLKNLILTYLSDMTSVDIGYMAPNNNIDGFYHDREFNTFYLMRQEGVLLHPVVDHIANYEPVLLDYRNEILSGQTILALEIAMPVYSVFYNNGTAGGDPVQALSIAESNWQEGKELLRCANFYIFGVGSCNISFGSGSGASAGSADDSGASITPWIDRTTSPESAANYVDPGDEQFLEFVRNLKDRITKTRALVDAKENTSQNDGEENQLVSNVYYEFMEDLKAVAAGPQALGQIKLLIDSYLEKRFTNETVLPVEAQTNSIEAQPEATSEEIQTSPKIKTDDKTSNSIIVQNYLAQGKESLTQAPQREEAMLPETAATNPA